MLLCYWIRACHFDPQISFVLLFVFSWRVMAGRHKGYLSRKSYWKQNTTASMSQQHAHRTVFCFSFSTPFSNCWLLWLNFITSYTALTADVFSSMYSLVIPRLYPESLVFHGLDVLPTVRRQGWARRGGGFGLDYEAVLWSVPKRHAYLDKHQRKVDPGALTCVLGGGNSPIEELLAGIHPLKDPYTLSRSELPLGQRTSPEPAVKRPRLECRKGLSGVCPPSAKP